MAARWAMTSAIVATTVEMLTVTMPNTATARSQEPTEGPAQALSQQDQPSERFRSSVDVVSVAAVVRDRKGRFVPDLSQRDFIIVESGQTRPIVGFKAEKDGPVRLAIVFDVSGSMRVGTKAADAREAARQVLSSLTGSDQAALFSFDTKLERVRDFTSDFKSLIAALDKVDAPYGQTSLYDAVAEAARAVGGRRNPDGQAPQRAAVVVLTDGVDTHSRLKPGEVSGIASEIDVPVYVMAVLSASMTRGCSTIGNGNRGRFAAGPCAMDWRGTVHDERAGAYELAARQIVSELRHRVSAGVRSVATPGVAVAGDKGAQPRSDGARAKRLHGRRPRVVDGQ
jgi:Mg-chelatase subunit ChlD